MKKLITFLFLIFTMSTMAQVDDYFANNPEWRMKWIFAPNYPCLHVWNYVYYLNGDTIIGDQTYKLLYKRGNLDDWYMAPPIPGYCNDYYTFDNFMGMLRQEGKKIFYYPANTEEVLLYDFDLAVGDTLPITYNNSGADDIYVTAIDSMLIGESYRKVFNLSIVYTDNILIEGVGFDGGFIMEFQSWEFPEHLQCFTLNGTTYYPELGAYCDLTVDVEEQLIENQNLEILPNPSTGLFTVSLATTENQNIRLIIHDISGRIIKQEAWPLENGKNVKSINLTDLKKGIYFLFLTGEDGRHFKQEKIILY